MIISFILVTLLFDSRLILYGEIRRKSLQGVKDLRSHIFILFLWIWGRNNLSWLAQLSSGDVIKERHNPLERHHSFFFFMKIPKSLDVNIINKSYW